MSVNNWLHLYLRKKFNLTYSFFYGSKLPQMMQCFSSQTAGCSSSETHAAASYIEVLMPVYKVFPACYSQDVATELYQSCQAPPTCSLKKAGLCYASLLNRMTCRYGIRVFHIL